jgi:hypothetical protein
MAPRPAARQAFILESKTSQKTMKDKKEAVAAETAVVMPIPTRGT